MKPHSQKTKKKKKQKEKKKKHCGAVPMSYKGRKTLLVILASCGYICTVYRNA